MTAGRVCILLCAIFGISWVAGYSPPQQAYHDMPGYNQQPNDKQRVDFDRPIEYVPDDFFQNVDQSIVFLKDSKVYSSVPLEEVDSPDGHRKLAGTVKIPGGVSSVTIEKSPQGQKTSQVIEYGHIEHDGPVVISTKQVISDMPEEVPSQQGIKVPTKKLPANDRNTKHVKPNNGQPENHGVNYDKDSKIDQSIVFHKDSTISSSVPLKEVDSPDGHRKLAGTVKIPGGVSSVSIEKSPQGQKTSQVIEYGHIEHDGPVVISTKQVISDMPEEVPSQQGINVKPEHDGVNYNKDSKIFSSVPLKEVSSSDGHRKLVGTSKIPGGVSSVVIEESPTSRHVSQVIKYRGIERNGPVIIDSNQRIRGMPLTASRNGSSDNSTYPLIVMIIISAIMNMYSKMIL